MSLLVRSLQRVNVWQVNRPWPATPWPADVAGGKLGCAAPPFTPKRGRAAYPATADRDGHSANLRREAKLLFSADEDFCKTSGSGIEKGYGYMRVWDESSLAAPVQIGDYRTPSASTVRWS
jgi:hypothetical protein